MLIDTHKQVLVGTGMLGAVPAPSSGQADGHCYCGEVTGLFIQPLEMRDGEKLVNKFCLKGIIPSGERVSLYIADTMEDVQRVFTAAFNSIMDPNTSSVVYLNIPLIIQQIIQEEAARAARAAEEGPPPMETVGPDGNVNPRLFVPRKGGPPVEFVEKGHEEAQYEALAAEGSKTEASSEEPKLRPMPLKDEQPT